MPQPPFAVVPLPFTIYAVDSQVSGAPAQHLAEFRHIGLVWRTATVGSVQLRGDFGSVVTLDFFAMLQANAVPGTAFRLRLSNASDFSSTVYDSGGAFLPFISPAITRPDGLYSSHFELPAPQAARFWQIDISVGVLQAFEAATVVFGRKLTFANYYNPGFGFGVEDLGDLELTRWGVPDETEGAIFRRLDCTFGWMSQADMDQRFRPLVERLGKRGVALFCFDPEATVNRQARTYLGWLRTPPVFTGAVNKFDRFESEWSVLSMI